MKFLIARLNHETNTFSPVATPLAAFFSRRPGADRRTPLLAGQEAIAAYRGTNVAFAAFLDAASAAGAVAQNYSIADQVMTQTLGVIVAVIWSGVVSFVALMIVKAVIGLRVPANDERQGLDVTTHGENAYNS